MLEEDSEEDVETEEENNIEEMYDEDKANTISEQLVDLNWISPHLKISLNEALYEEIRKRAQSVAEKGFDRRRLRSLRRWLHSAVSLWVRKFVSDEEFAKFNLRGLYLGNYQKWDPYKQTDIIKNLYDWEEARLPFERTYRTISNLDDMHENGIHDYMKWIKFGYGRCSDHASKDIRLGYYRNKYKVNKRNSK